MDLPTAPAVTEATTVSWESFADVQPVLTQAAALADSGPDTTQEAVHAAMAAAPADAVAAHAAAPAPGDATDQTVANLETRLAALEAAVAGPISGIVTDARDILSRLEKVEAALADLAAAFPMLSTLTSHFGPAVRALLRIV